MMSHQVLLLLRRLELAGEFVKSVEAAMRGRGVLLSGPNGVGKSGVGFLAYLQCAARRLPAIYLNGTQTWVEAAQRGEGDAFLLSALWTQNADLIAASPPLRTVFAAALRDEAGAFTYHVMDALRRTVLERNLGVGVILDDVQHITAAVKRCDASDSSTGAFIAGSYFRNNWHDWMNDNRAFVRMSITSAHGERDFKLPSGEGHRLRIVEPLADSQRDALLTHRDSPGFVSDPSVRERVVFYAGNVLRTLVEAARNQTQLSRLLGQVHMEMQMDCDRWLACLPALERFAAAAQCKELLAGKLYWPIAWCTTKGLYYAGIMYRTADSNALRPVSAIASSAYLISTARYILCAAASAVPLSFITDGRQRGCALETRVLARMTTVNSLVGTKSLAGSHSTALSLRVSYALPFSHLDEVVPRESPVLYQPLSSTYPCDGIIMPAIDDAEGAIVILECSALDPRKEERVTKVHKLFRPDGVVTALAQRSPQLRCIVALVFDGDLAEEPLGGDAASLAAATAQHGSATTSVRVLDRSSLVALSHLVL